MRPDVVRWADIFRAVVDGTGVKDLTWRGEPGLDEASLVVRDESWGTVPLSVEDFDLTRAEGGFRAVAQGRTRSSSVALSFMVEIVGNSGGLAIQFDATATSDFVFRRIGLCLIHPADTYVGRPVSYRDGLGWHAGVLPNSIGAQAMDDGVPQGLLRPFSCLDVNLAPCLVSFDFGDRKFEIEDQRNWSDPSFKTYSAAEAGAPILSARRGQPFSEMVTISVSPDATFKRESAVSRVEIADVVGTLPLVFVGGERPIETPGSVTATDFASLNRSPESFPETGPIRVGINGSVHAASSESVMATTRTHGEIARTIKALKPGRAIEMDPLTFSAVAGEWRGVNGEITPTPPDGDDDVRRSTPFGASWMVSSLANLSAEAEIVAYFNMLDLRDAHSALAQQLARLRQYTGLPQLAVHAPRGISALAVQAPMGVVGWVVNTTPRQKRVQLWTGEYVVLKPFATHEVAL